MKQCGLVINAAHTHTQHQDGNLTVKLKDQLCSKQITEHLLTAQAWEGKDLVPSRWCLPSAKQSSECTLRYSPLRVTALLQSSDSLTPSDPLGEHHSGRRCVCITRWVRERFAHLETAHVLSIQVSSSELTSTLELTSSSESVWLSGCLHYRIAAQVGLW